MSNLLVGDLVAEEEQLRSEPRKQVGLSCIHSIGLAYAVSKILYGSAISFPSNQNGDHYHCPHFTEEKTDA